VLLAPRLFGVAIRVVRDRARAEDVLQDAFVTIWERAGVFSLRAIVRHDVDDDDRAQPQPGSRAIVAQRTASPTSTTMARAVWTVKLSPCRSPEDAQVFAESSRHVRAALMALPGHYRQALMLAYGHGCSHSEVAASMGVPIGTAKSWVRRGLSDLRTAFASTSLSGVAASIRPVDRVP
jgi:RNA polymerase sigma-70 factor, ECF subfamily